MSTAYSRNWGAIDGAGMTRTIRRWCMRPPKGAFFYCLETTHHERRPSTQKTKPVKFPLG